MPRRLGDLSASVDWANVTGNGANLTAAQLRSSGIFELARAVADAAGVWYNVTKDRGCYDIAADRAAMGRGVAKKAARRGRLAGSQPLASPSEARADVGGDGARGRGAGGGMALAGGGPNMAGGMALAGGLAVATAPPSGARCPTCPPCDDCPPCPVSYCDWEDSKPCDHPTPLPKTFSWDGICCNDALSQVNSASAREAARPPTLRRHATSAHASRRITPCLSTPHVSILRPPHLISTRSPPDLHLISTRSPPSSRR